MTTGDFFERLERLDPGSSLIDAIDTLGADLSVSSDFEASALRASVETAKWSASQNPQIAERYCRELGWAPNDLAAMMTLQCALASVTSGEFFSARGALTPQGQGFRLVTELCLRKLVETGCITHEIADIERRELEAEIAETEPSTDPNFRPTSRQPSR